MNRIVARQFSLRQKIGSIVYDLPKFVWAMRPLGLVGKDDFPWVYLRNRKERLVWEDGKQGVLCDWRWTSDLHGPKVFPSLGIWLMKRALKTWPIVFKDTPAVMHGNVEVSFIIGHRGTRRLPQLLATLRSLFAQRDVRSEYIVVEQDDVSRIRSCLPNGVEHIWIKTPTLDMPYSRAWSFNVGARAAKGKILVLHDSDICAPADYAAELVKLHRLGYRAMRLQRFIFFLNDHASNAFMGDVNGQRGRFIEAIMQNSQGGTIALEREAYFEIGGYDESFIGWGGEDNEFFQRCQTMKCYPYMYLPFVHLYHAPQRGKRVQQGRMTAELLEARSAIPVAQRIAELAARAFGNLEQLDPPYFPTTTNAARLGLGSVTSSPSP